MLPTVSKGRLPSQVRSNPVFPQYLRRIVKAQFSQMRPVAMAPSIAPRMPMYPPGAPGLGQQLFFGQAPPAIIPPQEGKEQALYFDAHVLDGCEAWHGRAQGSF